MTSKINPSDEKEVYEWLESMQEALKISKKQNNKSSELFDGLFSNLPIHGAKFLPTPSNEQSEGTPLSEAHNLSSRLQITLITPQNSSELVQLETYFQMIQSLRD